MAIKNQGQPQVKTVDCPRCGQKTLESAPKCGHCSEPLEATCRKCGAKVPNHPHCQKCGTALPVLAAAGANPPNPGNPPGPTPGGPQPNPNSPNPAVAGGNPPKPHHLYHIEASASGSHGQYTVRVQVTDATGVGVKSAPVWVGTGGYDMYDLGKGQVIVIAPGTTHPLIPAGAAPATVAKTDTKGLLVCRVFITDRRRLKMQFSASNSQADTGRKELPLYGAPWKRPVAANGNPVGFLAALQDFWAYNHR